MGARVLGRLENGNYYRGFVTAVTFNTVSIKYDDGDTNALPRHDPKAAVILDRLPCYSNVNPGQRLIAYRPGWRPETPKYSPAVVKAKDNKRPFDNCHPDFDVQFVDGTEVVSSFYQIRLIS